LTLLRHGRDLPQEQVDILIRMELARYGAKQRDLGDYDEILRRRIRKEDLL